MGGGRKYIIRGRPGSGKSMTVGIIRQELKRRGIKVGGISTPELRERGVRKGFIVEDLLTGNRSLFASTLFNEGPKVSKYSVKVEEFERIAIPALNKAMKECSVIIIDEIGKMELFSKLFVDLIKQIWSSDIIAIGTAPVSRIPLVENISEKSKTYWLERGKAEYVAAEILKETLDHLGIL